MQFDQRRRARRHDDPRPRPQLHPILPMGGEGAVGTSQDCAARSYDVEGMHVGTVAAGRIGLAGAAPAQALRHAPPLFRSASTARGGLKKELNLAWHPNVEDMVKVCDVVAINARRFTRKPKASSTTSFSLK